MKFPFLPGLAFALSLSFVSVQFCSAQELPANAQPKTSPPPAAILPTFGPPVTGPAPTRAPEVRSVPPFPIPPPPQPEKVLPQPPPESASFVPGVPNLRDLAMAVPGVEVWRAQSTSPQIPTRRHRRFELAYVVGKEPTLVRLRFHALAAGQGVIVQPGPGVTIDPPDTEFRVQKNGECVVSVALNGSFIRSDFDVYCCGVKTKVPLERASVEKVAAKESTGGNGQ